MRRASTLVERWSRPHGPHSGPLALPPPTISSHLSPSCPQDGTAIVRGYVQRRIIASQAFAHAMLTYNDTHLTPPMISIRVVVGFNTIQYIFFFFSVQMWDTLLPAFTRCKRCNAVSSALAKPEVFTHSPRYRVQCSQRPVPRPPRPRWRSAQRTRGERRVRFRGERAAVC